MEKPDNLQYLNYESNCFAFSMAKEYVKVNYLFFVVSLSCGKEMYF